MLAVLITPFLLALLFSLILEPPIALLTRLYGSRKLAALLVFLSFLTLLLLAAGLGFSHLFAELWSGAGGWAGAFVAGYTLGNGFIICDGFCYILFMC